MSSGVGLTGWVRLGCLTAAALLAVTACGSNAPPAGSTQAPPPTAKLATLSSIGAGEGQLNLIAWEGYVDDSWVKQFTQTTGCKVSAKYAGSCHEMGGLMKDGSGRHDGGV